MITRLRDTLQPNDFSSFSAYVQFFFSSSWHHAVHFPEHGGSLVPSCPARGLIIVRRTIMTGRMRFIRHVRASRPPENLSTGFSSYLLQCCTADHTKGDVRSSASRTKDAYAQWSSLMIATQTARALVRGSASITPRIKREVIYDGAFCANIDYKTRKKEGRDRGERLLKAMPHWPTALWFARFPAHDGIFQSENGAPNVRQSSRDDCTIAGNGFLWTSRVSRGDFVFFVIYCFILALSSSYMFTAVEWTRIAIIFYQFDSFICNHA